MSDQTAPEAGQEVSASSASAGRLSALVRSGALTGGRVRSAALAGAGLFALLALLLFTHVLSLLPGYPAVLVAFFVWAVLPGWLLQRAVFATRETGPIERAVVAFLMSMALAAAPGLIALQLHWSLQVFALSYAGLAAVVSALSLLWQRGEEDAPAREEPHRGSSSILLAALLGLAVVAVLSSPWWAGDRVPRDGDDPVYMGYVNNYMKSDALDASKPFLGTKQGGFGRMDVNGWVVTEALVAETAGVEAFGLLMDYLPPLMTVLAVGAMFALARGLFRNTTVALLAAAFVFAFAVLDLSPHDGYGRNIFLRIAQDKMVATYILLPAGLLLGARLLSRPTVSAYLAATLAVIGLFIVHPMGVLFFVFGFGFLVPVRALSERSLAPVRTGGLLLLPWAVLGVGFFLRFWLVEGLDADPLQRTLRFRREFFLVDLPGGFVIGNYHLVLHPFMMAAIVAAPFLWLVSRRAIGNQVVLATVLAVVSLFFVPVLATPLSEVVSDHALWRLPRLIPVPLILGYATYLAMDKLLTSEAGAVPAKASSFLANTSLGSVCALLLVTAGALVVQEQYGMLDNGAYYDRFSDTALLPWTGGSVFVGGFEHASLTDARPTAAEADLLEYLRDQAAPASIVLLPSSISSRYFAGVLDDVRPIDYRGAPDLNWREGLAAAFYEGSLTESEIRAMLEEYSVDFVVAPAGNSENDSYHVVSVDGDRRSVLGPAADGDKSHSTAYLGSFFADDFMVASGSPILVTGGSAWESYRAWQFDGTELGVISLKGGLRVPEDAADGELVFKLQFSPTARQALGSVQWGVWTSGKGGIAFGDNYDYGAEGEVDRARFTYSSFESSGERLELAIPTTTGDSFVAGDLIRFAVVRKGDATPDTNDDAASLLQVDVYYRIDR